MADLTGNAWDPRSLSGDSLVADVDDFTDRNLPSIQSTIEEEHLMASSSSQSAGFHKPGSSRVSYGSGPAPTTDWEEGRLFYNVDNNRLVAQGSSATTTVAADAKGTKLVLSGNSRVDGTNGENSEIHWETEQYDDLGIHSGSEAKVRLDAGKKWLINAQIRYEDPITDNVIVRIRPDGATSENGQIAFSSHWSVQRAQATWIGRTDSAESYVVQIAGLGGSDQTLTALHTYMSVVELE